MTAIRSRTLCTYGILATVTVCFGPAYARAQHNPVTAPRRLLHAPLPVLRRTVRAQITACYARYKCTFVAADTRTIARLLTPDFALDGNRFDALAKRFPTSTRKGTAAIDEIGRRRAFWRHVSSMSVEIDRVTARGSLCTTHVIETVTGARAETHGKSMGSPTTRTEREDTWAHSAAGWKLARLHIVSEAYFSD